MSGTWNSGIYLSEFISRLIDWTRFFPRIFLCYFTKIPPSTKINKKCQTSTSKNEENFWFLISDEWIIHKFSKTRIVGYTYYLADPSLLGVQTHFPHLVEVQDGVVWAKGWLHMWEQNISNAQFSLSHKRN